MDKLHFSIRIDRPRAQVWNIMLEDSTYRRWTEPFHPGSHYVGDWKQGSKILFLGPDEKGGLSGMVSRIRENRLHEHIAIEHLGLVMNGVEDTTSPAVRGWAGALEAYTFRDLGAATEVQVDMDIDAEHKAMFEEIWPKALQKLKDIAERP